MALVLAAWLSGCGGSGSTGLIYPESAYLDAVRRDGNCLVADAVTYCATDSPDAVAPDGQSALGPNDQGMPCPSESPPCPGRNEGDFAVRGFPAGAACAPAVRAAGSMAPWRLGPLVPITGPAPTAVTVSLPPELDSATAETALLCFTIAPPALPPLVAELADAGPDVVFVPR